ncbi:BAG domain [Musa troglodytarum]|uniref:BAG domain n=1 Tax=Musa troglodytarum TaxID=320322 RepID=A0A9E7K267_9LILI|nr:BAG domain [Musa troglodytarum]
MNSGQEPAAGSLIASARDPVRRQQVRGELKKLLTAEKGLQPAYQRLLYKGKERWDGEFIEVCSFKNRAEDPSSLERRYVEMRKNAKIQGAQRAISAVSMEVDKMADQACLTILIA